MYTIVVNDDKTLTTSIKTSLLHGTTTDEIWFLYKEPEELPEGVTKTYSAFMHYETDKVTKTETLDTDAELYKERVRFILPRSSVFFNSRGLIQVWLEMDVTTTTIVPIIDPVTGEIIDEITETTVDTFTTLPTVLFIDDVKKFPRHRDDNVIRITRGDSLTVNITLTDDDGYVYEPVEGDVVWFTVKKSAVAEDVLIRKQIDISTLTLEIVELDTKNLAFGKYAYEVEVILVSGDHYTVIKNAPFIIMEELH